MVCEDLGFLGVRLDQARNLEARGLEHEISCPDSRVRVWVVPTDESRLIAEEVVQILS